MVSYAETPSKPSKAPKKIMIEGEPHNFGRDPQRFDPMGGFKKLLQGFCDPGRIEDDETLPTTPDSLPDLSSQQEICHVEIDVVKKLSYGFSATSEDRPDPPAAAETNGERYEKESEYEDESDEEEETDLHTRDFPELKATHTCRKLRVRRGLEVTFVGLFSVVATLFALLKLGYQMDFNVIESQFVSGSKKLISIVYNDDTLKSQPFNNRAASKPLIGIFRNDEIEETEPFFSNDRANLLLVELKGMVAEIRDRSSKM
jgi:hypothetical protein